jgi:hypothetical protein
MPKVTGAFQTYDAKGNREDLANIIYNISPTDTPIMSAAGRRNATNTQFDWQVDALAAVNLSNAEIEGFQNTNTVSTATTRLRNVCQISKKDVTVTGTQQSANSAGRKDELAYQIAKRGKELKRDMESIIGQNQALDFGSGGVGTETARKTRAIEHWLTANVTIVNTMAGASYVAPASETATYTDGTQRAFTETLLKAAIKLAYARGAAPGNLIVGPSNKAVVSGFTGRSNAREIVGEREVVATVSVYASDFGDIRVIPSRYTRDRTALLLDFDYLKLAYYRNFKRIPLAKVGDAVTELLLAEYGLEMSNVDAHQAIADLLTP